MGLDHFESHPRRGFHHHVCLVMMAYDFLALEQLRAKRDPAQPGKKGDTERGLTLPAIRCALQRLLSPRARPNRSYLKPHIYKLN